MGTTSEKLTYLSGTKDKLKIAINAMGGEIDDDTFRSYPETLNDLVLKSINGEIDLYDEYPKKQSSGTSITMEGVELGKALIELNPSELSQATIPAPDNPVPIKKVTGNNSIKVFGTNMIDQSVLLSSLTYNPETGFYGGTASSALNSTITGIFKENTRYTIAWLSYTTSTASVKESIQFKFNYTDGTETHFNTTGSTTPTKRTYTSTSGKTVSSFQIVYVRARDINIKELMLYEGTDTTQEFEQYQSQTYPINLSSLEYCKIGDYSDEFALSTGKNLFDKDNANILNSAIETNGLISASNSGKILYISIEGGKTYTIIKTKGYRFRVGTTVNIPSNGDTVDGYTTSTTNKLTITTSSESNYLVVYFYLNGTDTLSEQRIIDSIMISLGDNDYPYEPYGNGNWFIRKNIEKIVFNGQETWSNRTNSAGTKQFYTNTFRNDIINNNNIQQKCTHGRFNKSTYNSGVVGEFHIVASSSNRPFYICVPSDLDIDTFKTNIGLNNITCYYVMEMAIGVNITDTTLIEQLNNLYNQIKSYKGQTNITQTNAELPFEITISALKDLDI